MRARKLKRVVMVWAVKVSTWLHRCRGHGDCAATALRGSPDALQAAMARDATQRSPATAAAGSEPEPTGKCVIVKEGKRIGSGLQRNAEEAQDRGVELAVRCADRGHALQAKASWLCRASCGRRLANRSMLRRWQPSPRACRPDAIPARRSRCPSFTSSAQRPTSLHTRAVHARECVSRCLEKARYGLAYRPGMQVALSSPQK